ncbi:Low-specificity L-threonine aldolase [Ascochyta lentis]
MSDTDSISAMRSSKPEPVSDVFDHETSSVEPDLCTSGKLNSAAFDFRSDFVTEPTPSMLNAPVLSSLEHDWEEDPTTTSLQKFMADLTSKPAALLVVSGTAGNQICLRAALPAPPHSTLAHHHGHIVTMEAGAVSSVSGSMVKTVIPAAGAGEPLSLTDVMENATVTDAVYDCPTRVISLEVPLNGVITTLSNVRAISGWARLQTPPIHMHLDGARLWEAVAAGAGSLPEYCAEFDSICLCFSKGLGAPMGSVIVGSQSFVKRARVIRKLMGGGMRQSAVIAAPARVAVEDTFLGGALAAAHAKAHRISVMWEKLGGRLHLPTHTNMVWLDLDAANVTKEEFWRVAKEEGIKVMLKGRIVVHYQISEEAIRRLIIVMHRVLHQRINLAGVKRTAADISE